MAKNPENNVLMGIWPALYTKVLKSHTCTHTQNTKTKQSEGMYNCGFYHIYNTTNILTLNLLTTTIVAPPSNASKWQMGFNSVFKGLIHTLISMSSTVGGTEPLEIHSAVIRANLIRSNSEKPLMNIKIFFISSSNIFSRYLYRRISLMNTCNTTYTI
jgi:hypothetical protein